MKTILLHPATSQLIWFRAQAKVRHLRSGFATPRRFVLSVLGLILSGIWLGNVALSIFLREPTEPARFRSLVAGGFLVYALWHVLKTACRRPEDAFEWSDAEREQLRAAPFRRHELVAYRVTSIASSGAFKALCFALLMLPDLKIWWAGAMGAFLGLLFLDLLRMALETCVCGASPRSYQRLRIAIIGPAFVAGICMLVITLCSPRADRLVSPLGLLWGLLDAAVVLKSTWLGQLLESPFRVFANIIAATQASAGLAGWLALGLALVLGMAYSVFRLDSFFQWLQATTEQANYQQLQVARSTHKTESEGSVRLTHVPWRGGMGPLAWRQAISVGQYRTSLLIALSAPAILSVLPLLVHPEPRMAILHVIGSLAFFSFLLIPSAVKFDFRRDVQRISVLKALPLSPKTVVTGQLATPLLVAMLFQSAVLIVTYLVHPSHPGMLGLSMLMLAPLNLLIFALDNLIFLLYPYRLNQEGLEVFLRTTLTFTAKGLVFSVALGVMLGWAILAPWISGLFPGSIFNGQFVFAMGLFAMLCAAAAATSYALVRAFERFDPSQDTPA